MDPNDDEQAWLHGFAVTGVGGVRGDTPVRSGPLGRMNFLVGRNNHGKSTLLKAAARFVAARGDQPGRLEVLVPTSRQIVEGFLRNLESFRWSTAPSKWRNLPCPSTLIV